MWHRPQCPFGLAALTSSVSSLRKPSNAGSPGLDHSFHPVTPVVPSMSADTRTLTDDGSWQAPVALTVSPSTRDPMRRYRTPSVHRGSLMATDATSTLRRRERDSAPVITDRRTHSGEDTRAGPDGVCVRGALVGAPRECLDHASPSPASPDARQSARTRPASLQPARPHTVPQS